MVPETIRYKGIIYKEERREKIIVLKLSVQCKRTQYISLIASVRYVYILNDISQSRIEEESPHSSSVLYVGK